MVQPVSVDVRWNDLDLNRPGQSDRVPVPYPESPHRVKVKGWRLLGMSAPDCLILHRRIRGPRNRRNTASWRLSSLKPHLRAGAPETI